MGEVGYKAMVLRVGFYLDSNDKTYRFQDNCNFNV